MYVDDLAVCECPVAFLGVFLRRVPEETRQDRFLYPSNIFTTANNVQFMSENIKYCKHYIN